MNPKLGCDTQLGPVKHLSILIPTGKYKQIPGQKWIFLTKCFQDLKLTYLTPPIFKEPIFCNGKTELVWSNVWMKYFETRKAKLLGQNKLALNDESQRFPAAIWMPLLWVLCKLCLRAKNFRCVSNTQISLMDTVWTHYDGSQVTKAHHLK